MKKIFAVALTISVLMQCFISVVYAKEFPDVDQSHWAYQYINKLSDNGVINGYDDGTYKPSGTVKKSEFLKLVMAAVWPAYIGLDEVPTRIDHWVAPYLYLAEVDGVVDEGEYNLENLEEPITRIEMARIIAKADMFEKGHRAEFGATLPFVDISTVGTADSRLLAHAVSRGLILGYDDGTFKPDKTMTRAEAATMIYRFTSEEAK